MNRTAHVIAAIAIAATATLGLAACSAATVSPARTATSAPGSAAPTTAPGGGRGGFGGIPGVSGLVAAVSGSTAQVQSRTSQTAVSWTSATTFTAQQKTTDAALAVGACVSVQATPASSSGQASPSPITAATVEIRSTSGSGCASAFGGRGTGGAPGRQATPHPRPTFSPGSGRPGSRTRLGIFAFGTVTSLGANSFTVKPLARGGADAATVQTVMWSPQTAFTEITKGTAADVKVGVCMTARGTADDTGAVTAKTIAVSPAVNGACGGGFGGFGGFGGRQPQGGTGGSGQNGTGGSATGALYGG